MYALLLTLLAGCSTTPPSCPQIDGASDCDGDGYGADDCDDIDAAVHPGAADECDGYDDDCDGVDGLQSPWYADEDGDGYGSTSVIACANPGGRVSTGGDCDDTNMAINPGVPEVCDDAEVDEDCSGAADDVDPYTLDASRSEWYPDQDGDGHGDALATPSYSCSAPAGWASGHTDCDDVSANAHPGLAEICDDGLDNDCDGTANTCGLSDMELTAADSVLLGSAFTGAGDSVSGVGDVDGNGHEDVLVGASDGEDYLGAAYLMLGPVRAGSFALHGADAVYTGAGDSAGARVAGAGDLDGDGYDDMLVGAYMNDDAGANAGAVYVLRGGPAPASGTLATADVVLTGPTVDARAGYAADGAGDVNGDGWPDLVIGAFNANEDAGEAYLVLGGPTLASGSLGAAAAIYTGAISENAGHSVAGAGDVDGDGYADLLVGASRNADGGNEAGAAFLVFGSAAPTSGALAGADVTYTGEAASDLAGLQVAAAGDVDADGYADVLVGASRNDRGGDSAGAAYLLRGGSALASKSLTASDAIYAGEAAGDAAGFAVAGAGDTNQDGFDDLLIGANLNDTNGVDTGTVYLVFGGPMLASLSLGDADARLFGGVESYAGTSVAGAGDTDGDGADDILVGAVGANQRSGAAFLVLGTGL